MSTHEGDLIVQPDDDDGFDEALDRARRNAVEARVHESLGLFQDREFWANGLREYLAPGFLRRDRRKVIGMPDANADEWIAAQFEYERVAGKFGSWSDLKVIDVRGDRLVVFRVLNQLGDLGENELVALDRFDDAGRLDLLVLFDPGDVDEAIAEMDRLHAELTDD